MAKKFSSQDVGKEVRTSLRQAAKSGLGTQIIKRMTFVNTITSSGTGTYQLSVTSGSVQSSPATEWSSFAARYKEYRVLKLKVTFVPNRPVCYYNGTTDIPCLTFVCVASPSGTFPTASVSAYWAAEGATLKSSGKMWSYVTMATEREHLLFNPTAAVIPSANLFAINVYALGGAFTVAYGYLLVEYIVEFREMS